MGLRLGWGAGGGGPTKLYTPLSRKKNLRRYIDWSESDVTPVRWLRTDSDHYLYVGGDQKWSKGSRIGLSLFVSDDEVRPKNMAIRISSMTMLHSTKQPIRSQYIVQLK